MKQIRIILLSFCLAVLSTALAQRVLIDANENWKFHYYNKKDPAIKANVPYFAQLIFEEKDWQSIAVPHTWSTFETTGELHPFIKSPGIKDNPYWWEGIGVYRKIFIVNNKEKGKKFFVEFDGVQKNCRVYINSKYIGQHFGGYGGFYFDLTDYILYDGQKNILCVEVSNLQDDPNKVPPTDAGNWDVYGGITRNVRFVITDRMFVPYQGSYKHEGGTFITTPQVSAENAKVRVKTWVKNEFNQVRNCTLTTVIRDKNNNEVARFSQQQSIDPLQIACFNFTQNISTPNLWSPDSPSLYTAYSEVWCDGKKLDEFVSKFGIRQFTWNYETNQLQVNGKPIKIRGFNRHQEFPWLGDAVPAFVNRMDAEDMKHNLNCNFIRPCHYISSPDLYETCDEIGLISCGDQPNVKDKDFSLEIQEMMVREMVRRYRNYPSIMLWNMGDETNRSADSEWAYNEDQTRFITCRHCPYKKGTGNDDIAGKYINLQSSDFGLAKLLRCSIRGWYDDDDMPLRPENQQQSGNEEYHHDVVRFPQQFGKGEQRIDIPNVVVWIYADHGCDREYGNSPLLHYNPKGWVDSYRIPKFVYYMWQANYAEKPMVFVHPQFWRKQYIGTKHKFTVDSNCEEVELFIKGKSFGRLKPTIENQHVVDFDHIPVSNSTLLVFGYDKGRKVMESTLQMAGEPYAITLKSSHSNIVAKQNSVAIIIADITDTKGNHIYGARNTLKWQVEGPATLVGPAEYVSDFKQKEQLTGTLYIDTPVSNVIRSTGETGIIKVKVSAEGLKSGELSITTEKNKLNNEEIQ